MSIKFDLDGFFWYPTIEFIENDLFQQLPNTDESSPEDVASSKETYCLMRKMCSEYLDASMKNDGSEEAKNKICEIKKRIVALADEAANR